jgi:hypothetical protein
MSFPGKKDGAEYSFGNPKGSTIKKFEVSKPPATGKYPNCTIAQYSNIEGGEILGERPGKIPHISHK